MIPNLLVLVISAASWVAALWLVLLPRLSGLPDPAIAAIHVAPPLAVTLLWVFLRRRIQGKHAEQAQAREERAQAERAAEREAAQKAYDDDMRQRRFGCDCRMVAFSRIGLVTRLPLPDPGQPNVDIRPVELDPAMDREAGSLLECLGASIDQALHSVYSTCPASMVFPIYVLPPAELPGEEVLACLRTAQSAMAEEFAPELGVLSASSSIRFLPASDSVPGSVLSLFESAPDMPGALILAFDSPYLRTPIDEESFDDDAGAERARFSGKPSEVVVALLMTNAELPSMLAAMSSAPQPGISDSMTPFWEKAIHAGGPLEVLSRMTRELRTGLADLPVLGRIHRAAIRHPSGQHTGALALTRLFQDVLEQAQINAGLIAPPFIFNEAAPAADEPKIRNPVDACGAIVHNAGSVDVAAKRLAALGGALYYFNIDLSPVDNDAALNVLTRIGDTGRASGIVQLALALVYAAQKTAPALCAEFLPGDSIAASFVMPTGAGSGNGQH